MPHDLLARLRRNPFLLFDIERVRTLAFEKSKRRSAQGLQSDPDDDWLTAEREETVAQTNARLVAVRDSEFVGLAGKDFDDLYELADAVTFPTYEPQKKKIIGTKNPRRCSLCGASAPPATFRKEAHVLPEAVGSRWLITYDECDGCNERFGREQDDELGKMLLPQRVMARVSTKNSSTAKLKMWDLASSIGGQDRDDPLEIALRPDDESVKVRMIGDRQMVIEAKTMPYRPVGAIKSLARSAWQLLPPASRPQHEEMRRWIRGEFSVLPSVFWHFFLPGPGLLRTTLAVWTTVDTADKLPGLILAFALGNAILVWAAPDWETRAHVPALLPKLPRPLFPNTSLRGERLRITRDERVRPNAVAYEVQFADQGLAWRSQPCEALVEARAEDRTWSLRSECATPRSIEETKRDGVLYKISGGELVGTLTVDRGPARRSGLDLEMPLQVTYSFGPPKTAGADLAKTRAFVEALFAGASVCVTDVAGPRTLFTVPEGQERPVTREFLDRVFRICEAVGTVNREFSATIEIDPASDSESERNALLLATAISNGGEVGEVAAGGTVTWLVSASAMQLTLDAIAKGPHVWIETTFSYPVFGMELAPGPERITLDNARLVRPPEELMAIAAEGGVQLIPVEIACDRVIHRFQRWALPTPAPEPE